jgi:hypothetical protein
MARLTSSHRRQGLGGFLLVIATLLLTLGLFVVAVMATPRAEAASRHSHDSYSRDSYSDDEDRAYQSGKSFHWDGHLARGRTLEVHGINGSIEVEGTSGGDVVVDAEKRARKSDPEDVKIVVDQTKDGVRVCALYRRKDGSFNDDCEHQNVQNNDVQVTFHVRVPAGVNLAAQTVNGRVQVDDLHGDVEAQTVNGGIEVNTTGIATANTVNGSIRVEMGEGDWGEGLDFRTVNGSIAVTMPGNVDADLVARAMNGHVDTDFPITASGRISSHRLTGTIGDGGPHLRMETINGGIELRSSGRSRRDRD